MPCCVHRVGSVKRVRHALRFVIKECFEFEENILSIRSSYAISAQQRHSFPGITNVDQHPILNDYTYRLYLQVCKEAIQSHVIFINALFLQFIVNVHQLTIPIVYPSAKTSLISSARPLADC